MQKTRLLPSIGIAFLSGILMGLAPAPLNFWWLAWVALVPLWVMVFGNSKLDIRYSKLEPTSKRLFCTLNFAWLIPLAWGIGYHGLALSWITGLHPLTWMGIPWLASVAIALFCWAFITLWGAALVMFWAGLMQQVSGGRFQGESFRGQGTKIHIPPQSGSKPHPLSFILYPLAFFSPSLSRVLLGTALWCGLEWLWSLGALDWTSLSYTQSPGNLVILHLGQISGPLTVTGAIVAVNGLLAEAWMNYKASGVRSQDLEADSAERSQKRVGAEHPLTVQRLKFSYPRSIGLLAIATILLGFLHLVGYGLYVQPLGRSDETALKVGIVQGNVPTRIKLFSEGLRRAEEGYTRGYEQLVDQGVAAVLTPEGALPYLWNRSDKADNPFYQAVLRKQAIAWLGTFTVQDGRIARSLLNLAGNGEPTGGYNKIKLVPLGEYIPFHEILGGVVNRLTPLEADGLPGTLEQRFETSFGRAIASICYDSAFPQVFQSQAARGGQFILTASNLDPYSEVLMAQHEAQDIMRAIETDRWAVRATNTGYSGIVDPHGQVMWRSHPHIYEIHADTIYRRQTQTLYVRWGNWLTPMLLGLGTITLLSRYVVTATHRRN